MNTFQTGVLDSEIDFEYKVGSVSTKIPWYQPTNDILNNFIKTIKKIENYDKYDLFLVGGVVNGKIEETWDVDIIACGDILPEQFERFLHELYDIALNKFNILVDVRWFNVPIEHFNHLINAKKTEKVKTVRFGSFTKRVGKEVSVINLFEKGKKISKNLVELDVTIPSIKGFKNKNGNKYIKI
jgi:hypothetical protein